MCEQLELLISSSYCTLDFVRFFDKIQKKFFQLQLRLRFRAQTFLCYLVADQRLKVLTFKLSGISGIFTKALLENSFLNLKKGVIRATFLTRLSGFEPSWRSGLVIRLSYIFTYFPTQYQKYALQVDLAKSSNFNLSKPIMTVGLFRTGQRNFYIEKMIIHGFSVQDMYDNLDHYVAHHSWSHKQMAKLRTLIIGTLFRLSDLGHGSYSTLSVLGYSG